MANALNTLFAFRPDNCTAPAFFAKLLSLPRFSYFSISEPVVSMSNVYILRLIIPFV